MVTGSSLSGDEFTTGVHAMPDKNSEPLTLELITTCMNEAARELGAMEPDDPRGAALVAELSQLMQLRRAVRLVNDPLAGQCMDELAREMVMLKPGDPRRAQIVQEIMRLGDALKQA